MYIDKDWFGSVFCNPPYKNSKGEECIDEYIKKMVKEINYDNIFEGLLILPDQRKENKIWIHHEDSSYTLNKKSENVLILHFKETFNRREYIKTVWYPIARYYTHFIFYICKDANRRKEVQKLLYPIATKSEI